jgi:hypothetical protein
MAGEHSGGQGHGGKVHKGVDALVEATGGAVPWGLEAIHNGGGAEASWHEDDRRTDAASILIFCDGPLDAKCAGLTAGAGRGGEEAGYHVADREAHAQTGASCGI